MSSKSRLAALLAALGDRGPRGRSRGLRQQRRRRHHRRRRRRRRNAHRRLRHPLSPVRAIGKTKGELHRLRHRTDGSDRREDRPHARIQGHLVRHDLPRRRPGQVRQWSPRRRRSPKNARKAVAFSDPYYLSRTGDPGQRRQRRSKALEDLEGKIVGAQQGTTGLESSKKKPTRSELRPFPEGPDAVTALKAGTVEAVDHRRAGRRKQRSKKTAASKSPTKVPTEETVRNRRRQGRRQNCSTKSTKASKK